MTMKITKAELMGVSEEWMAGYDSAIETINKYRVALYDACIKISELRERCPREEINCVNEDCHGDYKVDCWCYFFKVRAKVVSE